MESIENSNLNEEDVGNVCGQMETKEKNGGWHRIADVLQPKIKYWRSEIHSIFNSKWWNCFTAILYVCMLMYFVTKGGNAYIELQVSSWQLAELNESLEFIKRYELGKLFMQDTMVFGNSNATYIELYYNELQFLLNNVGNLSISYSELDIISHESANINILLSSFPFILNLPRFSNIFILIGCIMTKITISTSIDTVVYAFVISALVAILL